MLCTYYIITRKYTLSFTICILYLYRLKKKKQKYNKQFRVIKATPFTICDVYYNKNKDKICNIRPDTLSQILYQASVHSNSKILVYDGVMGLLIGTLAYYMRGKGQILACYEGQQPHFEIVDLLNLTAYDTNIIQPVPSFELAGAADDVLQLGFRAPLVDSEVSDEGAADFGATITTDSTTEHTTTIVTATEPTTANSTTSTDTTATAVDDLTTTQDQQPPLKKTRVTNDTRKLQRSLPPHMVIKRHNTSGRQEEDKLILRQKLREGSNR